MALATACPNGMKKALEKMSGVHETPDVSHLLCSDTSAPNSSRSKLGDTRSSAPVCQFDLLKGSNYPCCPDADSKDESPDYHLGNRIGGGNDDCADCKAV